MTSETVHSREAGGPADVFLSFSEDELRRLLLGRAMVVMNEPELADRLVDATLLVVKVRKQANPEWICSLSDLAEQLASMLEAIDAAETHRSRMIQMEAGTGG